MSSRRKIYWRDQGGGRRAYGDFREWADVGGGQEALIPEGATQATRDPELAEILYDRRVAELRKARVSRAVTGVREQAELKAYGARHLREKKREGKVTEGTLALQEGHLDAAVEYFGPHRKLTGISPEDVQRWRHWLAKRPNGRGGKLSAGTIRKYLNTLSNLYRRAQAEQRVEVGYNPVDALVDKPSAARREAEWLEIPDAALYLEAARLYDPDDERERIPFAHALVATFLLTGGRKAEVLGLEAGDVSFDRKLVRFRPNEHRRIKSSNGHRSVPLWPQLEAVLREHEGAAPRSGLLFPSPRTGGMLRDVRKLLDGIAGTCGFDDGEIRTRIFRHTYCAARLQTTDAGAPVAKYTVARELGHGGTQLVDRIYGHLGEIRQREEVVEYRADRYRKKLGPRLQRLRAAAAAGGA